MEINSIALITLLRKETTRFFRIWPQTLLPPVITITLYFILFGKLVGSQIQAINGHSYMQFIAPGLIMMSIITNAYGNVVASFFSLRFQKSIEELLIAPLSNWVILLGFTFGGILRGLTVGCLVSIIALFFTHLKIQHFFIFFISLFFTSAFFSLAGFTNALFAKKFDDISIIPSFILTPLIYLGGVFYSLAQLPVFWQTFSKFNPLLYMINTFRYSIIGISDINVLMALILIVTGTVLLFLINLYLLNKGVGLKS
ncbi:MAG: ABC-type multidrug transport system permease component [uncultured bacterium]|nr:MAG: ABC-type multidrug transport system permease component [uncultured bacterium]